jgi:cytosine/adenosine deaminase-related metal-dependent hydrolase
MPQGGERRMIFRARVVVTMEGAPIENGAVRVNGNRIVEVGKFSEIKSEPSPYPHPEGEGGSSEHSGDEVVDLGERVLLPGLINAHCHLDYTCLRGSILPQKSFTDWIRAINSAKAKLNPSDYVKSIAAGFAEAQKFGTTSIVNFEAFPDLIMRTSPPIRTWWLAELIDVRDPNLPNELVDLTMGFMNVAATRGLAPHAPFTASLDLYRHCQETGRRHNLVLSTHLAESREECLMFREAAGPLYDFMKEFGRDMRDCGDETPLGYLLQQIALDERWLVVHLNELSEGDFDLLAELEVKFHVVHCPRSHKHFGHARFEWEKLRALGFNICLGTDSLASNADLSLFAEMRALWGEHPTLSPREILETVTTNPARALDRQSLLGRIAPGFYADLIAVPVEGERDVLEQIIAFDQVVPWTMIEGRCTQ